jgi:hypothetical protein
MTANPMFHARTNDLQIDFHFVHDKVASKQLLIKFISSKDQLADTFTKPFPIPKFIILGDNLNVNSLRSSLRGHIMTQDDHNSQVI